MSAASAPSSERRRAWCECGDTFDASGSGAGISEALDRYLAAFWTVHDGEGHGPTDAATARNARRRQERSEVTP